MKQKASRYMDRAMKHRDPRYARVLGRLGHYPSVAVTDNLETVPASAPMRAASLPQVTAPQVSAVPAMTTGTVPSATPSEATDAREPVEAPNAETGEETAPVKPAAPADAEKPATPKKRGRPPSAKLDHDDSGKAGGSRKKTAKEGRYKRRDMRASEE